MYFRRADNRHTFFSLFQQKRRRKREKFCWWEKKKKRRGRKLQFCDWKTEGKNRVGKICDRAALFMNKTHSSQVLNLSRAEASVCLCLQPSTPTNPIKESCPWGRAGLQLEVIEDNCPKPFPVRLKRDMLYFVQNEKKCFATNSKTTLALKIVRVETSKNGAGHCKVQLTSSSHGQDCMTPDCCVFACHGNQVCVFTLAGIQQCCAWKMSRRSRCPGWTLIWSGQIIFADLRERRHIQGQPVESLASRVTSARGPPCCM